MSNIIRVEHSKERPYLTLTVATIKALRNDLQALGLLVDLLARPDDWRVRPEALAKELGVSKASIYRILSRLIDYGYVKRLDETRRLSDGKFERRTHYTVYEDLTFNNVTETVSSSTNIYNLKIAGQEVPF